MIKRRPGIKTLLTVLLLVGQSLPAQAAMIMNYPYGYGYGYGWGYDTWGYPEVPVVVAHGPPLLTLDNQFYPVTVPGLTQLCELHPEICDTPQLQHRLHRLQNERIAGITMAWTGFAAAVLGPVVSTAINCSSTESYCRPNDAVLLSTVIGGLAVGITGLVLMPTSHNVIDYVNVLNSKHKDHPVQLKLSVSDQGEQQRLTNVALAFKL